TLSHYAVRRVSVMQWSQQFHHRRVLQAALDAHGTLPAGRQGDCGVEALANALCKAQPQQPCRCQDNRVVVTAVQLAQTGAYIASQIADLQIRAQAAQLTLPPQTGGAYP